MHTEQINMQMQIHTCNNVFHLALKYNKKGIVSNLLDNDNLNFLSLNNESLLQLAISLITFQNQLKLLVSLVSFKRLDLK